MKKLNNSDISQIISLYDDGYGTHCISDMFNVSRITIQRVLKKNGIILRKASPRNNYDVHFFDSYTNCSCYWAGFIMADGCVRSDRDCLDIHIKESDIDHLKKFCSVVNYSGKIINDISSNAVRVSLAGKWFPTSLNDKFGITKNKSNNSIFPKNIPDEFIPDFIRGIIDGDGSITITTCPTLSIVGTNEMNISLREIFYNIGVRLKSKNTFAPLICSKSDNISYISYSGKNAKIILDWVYCNSTYNIRLDRKYYRYKEYFNNEK